MDDPLLQRLREELQHDREDVIRFAEGEVATLEREHERLANRTDYRAGTQLELLKPQLARAYAELDAKQRRLAAKEERVRLIGVILPEYRREKPTALDFLASLQANRTVPTREEITELYLRNRRVEELRAVLFAETQDQEFSKSTDFIDFLKWSWHEQQLQRTHVLAMVLSPGHRPKATREQTPLTAARVGRVPRFGTEILERRILNAGAL